jgi:hypothetical protein
VHHRRHHPGQLHRSVQHGPGPRIDP